MEVNGFFMYDNKMQKYIRTEDIAPDVRYSNYITVPSGKAWGPREIQDFELILIVSGEFSYATDCGLKKVLLSHGDILCIPPGEEHVLKCEKAGMAEAVISCIHLELYHGSYIQGDYVLDICPQLVTKVKDAGVFHELFVRSADTFDSVGRFREAILNTVGREIWLHLAEYWEGRTEKTLSPRMKLIASYISDNLEKNITRKDIARKFHLTPEHVNAVFKKELGMSPTEYLHRIRIYTACRYLRKDGLSIKEAAEKTGFYDEFHFSRVFKKVVGISPSKYQIK